MDTSNLTMLHDHYKDSFSLIREREKQRDRLFMALIGILGLLFLAVQFPSDFLKYFGQIEFQGTKLNIKDLPISIITSTTWTALSVIMLRYCQCSIVIDRQYQYIHALEKAISSLLNDDFVFCREGRAYLQEYPAFSKWTSLFYAYLFPIITILLAAHLIFLEFNNKDSIGYHAKYDTVIAAFLFISISLYRGLPVLKTIYNIINTKLVSICNRWSAFKKSWFDLLYRCFADYY